MITEDSSATVNSNDVIGGRMRIDYPIKPAVLTPYTSVSVFYDKDLQGLHFNIVPERIVHPMLGVQYTENATVLLLNVGYRVDDRISDKTLDNGDQGQDSLIHLDGSCVPLFGHEALELNTSMAVLMGNNPVDHEDFMTMQNAVVWRHGEDIDFIVYQDYTTNTQLQSVGNITDGSIWLEAKYRPSPETSLRVLAGAYKAGIRCSEDNAVRYQDSMGLRSLTAHPFNLYLNITRSNNYVDVANTRIYLFCQRNFHLLSRCVLIPSSRTW